MVFIVSAVTRDDGEGPRRREIVAPHPVAVQRRLELVPTRAEELLICRQRTSAFALQGQREAIWGPRLAVRPKRHETQNLVLELRKPLGLADAERPELYRPARRDRA